ncbi:MAG: FAD-dependent monooxygenase [Caldisericaceae bacterium]
MEKTTVLIIGSGPSGTMLSHYLKANGIDSIITEKASRFRDKVCAGALPLAINDILPEYLAGFERTNYSTLSVNYKNLLHTEVSDKSPFMFGVKRASFDEFLRTGLDVKYNENFVTYEETKNGITARTDRETYTAKFLIGADGVGSAVRRVANFHYKPYFIVAEEAETTVSATSNQVAKIFLGFNRMGYGWTFPKSDSVSIGSGAVKGSFVRGTMNKFADNPHLKPHIFPISIWNGVETLTKNRVALVGEAGSIVDPFSAAGIYSGIASSKILSSVIKRALVSGSSSIDSYNEQLDQKIYQEFRYAKLLSTMFYPFLWLTKKVIVKQSTLRMALEEAKQGYISYREVYQRVANSQHPELRIILLLAKLINNI